MAALLSLLSLLGLLFAPQSEIENVAKTEGISSQTVEQYVDDRESAITKFDLDEM